MKSQIYFFFIFSFLFAGWEPEIKISDSPSNYVHIYRGNVLAIDKNNGIFIVWEKESLPYHFIYFSRSLDNGQTFEVQRKILPLSQISTPNIGADSNGVLYFGCSYYESGNTYSYLYKSIDKGETWIFVSNIGYGSFHYLIVDKDGTLHCLYSGTDLGALLAYAKSTNGGLTWNKIPLITPSQLTSFSVTGFVKDNFNRLHILMLRDTTGTLSGDVYYKRGLNNGNTWGQLIKLNKITQRATCPKIAVDSSNNVYVAWGLWSAVAPPNYKGKYFIAKSTTGGDSFPSEVMANGLIDSLRSSFHHHISFDGEKIILFNVWKSDTQLRLYFAKSIDGINWGEDTFLTEIYPYPKGPATPFALTLSDFYHVLFINTPIGRGFFDDDVYYKRWIKDVKIKEKNTSLFLNLNQKENLFYSIDGRKMIFKKDLKKGIYFLKFKNKKFYKFLKF